MHPHAGRSFLFFLILLGRLSAGEWSRWEGVPGEMTADRSTAVVARSRRDEAGDGMEKGYLFIYELHNQSGTQTAKVFLCFPVQDSATGIWKDIDPNNPTIVHDIRPMGTVTGTRYSPSPRGLGFESDIKWSEDLPPEEKPADSPVATDKPPVAAETPGTFEGVPLDTSAEGKDVLLNKMGDGRFMVVIELFRQDDMGDNYGDGDGGTQTWQQTFTELLEGYRNPEYYPNTLASFQILSSTPTAIKVRFDVVYQEQISFLLTHLREPPTRISEMVRLHSGEHAPAVASGDKAAPAGRANPNPGNGPADQGPEKFIPASQPAAKAGELEAGAVMHSGYWFDPDDKEAKASDPVIYVRVAGQAKRVRLSAAKEAYGVPQEAAPGTMSHYSERQGKVTIDRGTHRP